MGRDRAQGQAGLRGKRGPGPRAGGQTRALGKGTRFTAKPPVRRMRVPWAISRGNRGSVPPISRDQEQAADLGGRIVKIRARKREMLPKRIHNLRREGEIAPSRLAVHIRHAVHAPAAEVTGEAQASLPWLALPRGDGPDCEALREGGDAADASRRRARLTVPSLCRLPRLLGGVRPGRLAAHAHPQQHHARVQDPGAVLAHHLHHRRDRRHCGGRRPGHRVHHLVRSAARSVGSRPGGPCSLPGEALALGVVGVSVRRRPGAFARGCQLPAETRGGERVTTPGALLPWQQLVLPVGTAGAGRADALPRRPLRGRRRARAEQEGHAPCRRGRGRERGRRDRQRPRRECPDLQTIFLRP